MDFGVFIVSETSTDGLSSAIIEVDNVLREYLKGKQYGSSVESITIKCMICHDKPGFEDFTRIGRQKYFPVRRYTDYFTKEKIVEYGEYCYGVKFENVEIDDLIGKPIIEVQKSFVKKFVESFSNYNHLPKKITDFDKERFMADIIELFKSKAWMD